MVTGRETLLKAGKVKFTRVDADAIFWFPTNCVISQLCGCPIMETESEGVKSPKMYSVLSSRPMKLRVSDTRPWTLSIISDERAGN